MASGLRCEAGRCDVRCERRNCEPRSPVPSQRLKLDLCRPWWRQLPCEVRLRRRNQEGRAGSARTATAAKRRSLWRSGGKRQQSAAPGDCGEAPSLRGAAPAMDGSVRRESTSPYTGSSFWVPTRERDAQAPSGQWREAVPRSSWPEERARTPVWTAPAVKVPGRPRGLHSVRCSNRTKNSVELRREEAAIGCPRRL
ncbi:hypothetical protein NDU88_002968 [Pleurodeles waltl]|uniref:Uncharacterized protein n=1 Tax=Pleurodeles waltl TaxID=8319 RepID=A0AAV7UB88_PLEWA|nr:hypothetical protein NDU88_002968 [Pleurodeles waltl]